MRKNGDNVDWKKLWNYLSVDLTSNKDGDVEITVTPKELEAVDKFAILLGKMNPPEDDRLPVDIRRENDAKFKKYIDSQFKKYPNLKL